MTDLKGLTPGTRRRFVADGHDVAAGHGSERWRTPSGALLVEGATYEKVWLVKRRLVRIDNDGEHYRERGAWEIVSEALDVP